MSIPELLSGHVHVWVVSLHDDFDPSLTACLSQQDIERMDRLVSKKLRLQRQLVHIRLRQLLAHYTQVAPQDIKFGYHQHGKPYLVAPSLTQNLYFNVSHSKDKALVGVSLAGDLGVDIEYQKNLQYESLSQRFFASREHECLMQMPKQDRQQGFYHYWTLKEAVVKALGVGLSYPVRDAVVTVHPEKEGGALLELKHNESILDWYVDSFCLSDHYAAAVAVKGCVSCVRVLAMPSGAFAS